MCIEKKNHIVNETTVDINIENLNTDTFKEAQQRDEIIQDIKMKIENEDTIEFEIDENAIIQHKKMKKCVRTITIFMPNK